MPDHDPVNHPAHYAMGGVEVIDAIEAWGLNYHRANAVKYLARAGRKDPAKTIEDLRKARWYLDREIGRLERGKAANESPANVCSSVETPPDKAATLRTIERTTSSTSRQDYTP